MLRVPAAPRQWADISGFNGRSARGDALTAVPVGLSSIWTSKGVEVEVVVGRDGSTGQAEFIFSACGNAARSVGAPQAACDSIRAALGWGGKVNGWVPLGLQMGSEASLYLL